VRIAELQAFAAMPFASGGYRTRTTSNSASAGVDTTDSVATTDSTDTTEATDATTQP
jgi:hypothetical protein